MKYDQNGALLSTEIEGLGKPRRGKVRDIFEIGEHLLLVATDRISAFDHVMPNGIPDKGKVLTGFSNFWFHHLDWMPHHLVTMDMDKYPKILQAYKKDLSGRSMLVKKTEPLPVECVSRGYLIGSGWKDYQNSSAVCGIQLQPGYRLADKLETPIFTPAFKADQGEHDENITFSEVIKLVGKDCAEFLREKTLRLYTSASDFAREKGIIIADTKFEFGRINGEIILIDEVLTPDSSRFWPAEEYQPGTNPPSLDKQFVRDYLEDIKWDKSSSPPELPPEVVEKTRIKYLKAFENITGSAL